MTSARILIVEDENIVTMELKARLQALGHSIAAVASSGEEAIARAAETRPDLALMDIRLKGSIDGVEAAEQIRTLFDVPVVFLTAYSDDATLERVKATEPFGYLVKPFEERELHSTIDMALYKHVIERRLKEQKRWLAAILTSIGDAVIATDRQEAVEFMNPVAEALTGWSQAMAFGRPSAEILTLVDETYAPVASPIRQALQTGTAADSGDGTLLLARNGTEFPVDYNAAPLRDEGGEVTGAVLVLRSTAERKRMQQELLRSERLAAIGHFAASLAHEINNPLQAIALSMALVLNEKLGEVERKERLEAVRGEVRRLMCITRSVLGFVQNSPAKRQRIAVDEVVRHALTLTGKQLEHSRIEAGTDLPDSLPPVDASRDQLLQVLFNLIINAAEAMPDGGKLTLSAQSSEGQVKVIVRDTGPGLSPSALADAFRPFHTTKTGGTGLGLSISYSIIRQHGGTITADNAPEGGAVFAISLPIAQNGTPRAQQALERLT